MKSNYPILPPKLRSSCRTVIPALAGCLFFLNACDKNSKNSTADDAVAQSDTRTYSLSELAAKVRPSVFLLEVRDKNLSVVGTGTGFLINEKGWMATNRHVIEDAHSVTAKAENGARYQANGIVAFDPELDLVVLQLDSKDLPYLSIQGFSSDPLKVGEAVAVIGSPLGLEGTLSNGIISALRSESDTNGSKVGYIQITAPISPGSSGSPVLRMNGGVIGIATLASKAGSQNLNFAVPAHRIPGLIVASNAIEFSRFKSTLYDAQIKSSAAFQNYLKAQSAGDHKNAHLCAKDIVERFPENPKSFLCLAETLTSLGLYDEALDAIKKNLEIDPNCQDGLTQLGWIQMYQNFNEAAVVSFQKSLKLSDADASAWQGLGIALKDLRRHDEAVKAFKRSAAIDPTRSYTWSGLGESILAADYSDKNGEAQSALVKAVSLNAANFDALLSLGEICTTKSQTSNAIYYFRKASAVNPKHERVWEALGNALRAKDLLDEAETSFRKAVEYFPDSYKALENLGDLLTENNKPKEAITVLRKALKMGKSKESLGDIFIDAIIYSELGQAYFSINDLDNAIDSFLSAIKISPQFTFVWRDLGIAYVKNKMHEKAIDAFSEGERIAISNPLLSPMRDREMFWKQIVSELEKKKNAGYAYLYCKRAIDLKSTNSEIWYIYGKSLSYKGIDREAVVAYQKSLELKPEQSDAWCGLGFSLYKTGSFDKARDSLNKAIKLKKIKTEKDQEYIREMGVDTRPKIITEMWNDAIVILTEDTKRAEPNNLVKELLGLMLDYNQ